MDEGLEPSALFLGLRPSRGAWGASPPTPGGPCPPGLQTKHKPRQDRSQETHLETALIKFSMSAQHQLSQIRKQLSDQKQHKDRSTTRRGWPSLVGFSLLKNDPEAPRQNLSSHALGNLSPGLKPHTGETHAEEQRATSPESPRPGLEGLWAASRQPARSDTGWAGVSSPHGSQNHHSASPLAPLPSLLQLSLFRSKRSFIVNSARDPQEPDRNWVAQGRQGSELAAL